jgi:hypothetical protein
VRPRPLSEGGIKTDGGVLRSNNLAELARGENGKILWPR